MRKQSYFWLIFALLIASLPTRATEITLLTWPEYISPAVVQSFEQQTGIKVTEIHYDSDDSRDRLLNLSSAQGYDVIVTNRVRLPMYIAQKWITSYQASNLPNLIHIEDKWHRAANEFGPYCVPYFWGTIGILYNKKHIKNPPNSWQVFFNQLEQYSAKVNLLNDSRTLLSMALIASGFDSHSDDHGQINQAASLIHKKLPFIHSFSALNLEENNRFNSEEIWISMAYNGDALYLKSLNPDLEFIQPSDGTNAWLDCLTISHASPNKKIAEQFINHLLIPKHSVQLALDLQYPTPNLTAYQQLPAQVKQNTTLYPKLSGKVQLNKVISANSERYFQLTYKQLVFAHQQLRQGKK